MTKIPSHWHSEADLIAVGSGLGGLASAITAHDHGLSAIVLEKADQLGGVTAYSFGEVWIAANHHAREAGLEDTVESGFRYMRRISMGYGDDRLILNQAVHGPEALRYFEENAGLRMRIVKNLPDYYWPEANDGTSEGRFLEVLPFPAITLGEWQEKTRLSPHVPYGLSHVEIFGAGGPANIENWDFSVMSERMASDVRCLGPGLAAYFVKAAADRGIAMRTGVDVAELIEDAGRVIGVRCVKDGADLFFKACKGVVLATSGYDNSRRVAASMGQLAAESMVMPAIDGAAIRLAGRLGGRVVRVPDVTMLGYHVAGEEHEGDLPLWRNALYELGLPHTIVVNSSGRRFGDESFYRSLCFAIDYIDGGTQTHPNFPCWVVFDSQARRKYPFGPILPGQPFPEGIATTADSIGELARKIGIDASALEETVTRFNGYCQIGRDPEFSRGTRPWGAFMSGDPANRPNANLGPLMEGPFYAIELMRLGGGGISAAGVAADEHCRVLDYDDRPIEGLYVAGNAMARLDNGASMQSGVTNARGMTHGYLIGRHAAGNPSDLLGRAIASLGIAG